MIKLFEKYETEKYIIIKILFIKISFKKDSIMSYINSIVWWIPIRKYRDNFRDYLYNSLIANNLDIMKYNRITLFVPPLDNENRELLKELLYTKYNQNSSRILHQYFIENKGRAIHKSLRYFDVYERYFYRFRGKDINILEIGVQNGGSTKMWKHYFSYGFPNAKVNIYGVDIDPRCKSVEEDGIQIFIGSQSDREFLRKLKNNIPKVDIVIDDGGHIMEQQKVTFEEIYPHITDNGVYLCEDLETSYWKSYGGGYKNKNSFIEYSKDLIDYLNSYHATKNDNLKVNDFTNSAYSISYYERMIIIEKRIRDYRYNNIVSDAIVGEFTITDIYTRY